MLALPLALRSLRERPAKTLFSVLGIALGVATAVAIFTLDSSTVRARVEARADAMAQVDLEAIPSDPRASAADALARLRATEGVAAVGAIAQATAAITVDGRDLALVRLVGLDAVARTSPAFDAYRVSEGEDLAPDDGATGDACLLGAAIAERIRARPGAVIELKAPGGERYECIDGQLRRIDDGAPPPPPVACSVVGLLDRYHLGKQGDGALVVVPFPMLARIFAGEAARAVYWVSRAPGTSPEALKAVLQPEFATSADRAALVGEAADERAFRNGVRICGLLALLLGLFVIFHTLSMSLLERVREIAMLGALGATRGQIGRAFFLEGLAIAVLGAGTGLALGIGIARAFLLGGYTTLGRTGSVEVLDVRWGPCLAIAAVGLGVALVGSVLPLLKARGISPARALASRDLGRETDLFRGLNLFSFALLAGVVPALYFFVVPVVGEASRELARILVLGGAIFLLFLGFLLLAPRLLGAVCAAITRPLTRWRPLEGFLASRSMKEGLARVAVSAAVLALVAAALLTLKAITASLRHEVASWGDAIERKVFVSSVPPLPRARVDALRSIPGVLGVETLGTWVDSPFLLRAIRASDVGPHGPFRDPDVARRFEETESVILSTALARALRKDVGSEVAVAVASGAPRRLRVIAIDDSVGYFPSQRELGVVSEEWMRRWFCTTSEEVSQLALRLAPGIDPGATSASVAQGLADLPPVKIRTGRSVREYEVADIDRDFRLFDLILGLVALLAGVGVLNALLLAAIERRKEIGVLKALGMTSGQLAGTVALEAAAIGAVGGACGIALGLAFGLVAVDALSRLAALPLPTIFEPPWLGLAFGGSIALALLASAIPIQRANQFRAAEAVRYE